MTRERERAALELFDELAAIPPDERADALAARCGDDVDLRAAVEALFAHDVEESDDALLVVPAVTPALPEAPEQIGPYRIDGVLGSGGMGVVYRAIQERPNRSVAVKVLLSGIVTRSALQRFEREMQLLGRLQHPGIAQIFEAGVAEVGAVSRPFFAMELVDGDPVTEHAERAKLGTAERLELVARICDAVEHAHRKGVVHRDLKPGNVLVDASGQPKVLDFGIARATDADLATATRQTQTGQVLGTLAYMSPEQASAAGEGVDHRTDVYSLGVIAYEMLSGNLPRDVLGRPVLEAIRTIVEGEPTQLGRFGRDLRGDIETVVHTALEKDVDRRYRSAADFAADIRRHLGHEPISARPPSTIYQLKKFARRNRKLVAVGTVSFIGLLIAFAVTLVALLDARRERDAAIVARGESDGVTDTFVDMFRSASAFGAGPQTTVRQLLALSEGGFEARYAGLPRVEGRLRFAVGSAYLGVGDFDEAERQLERALALHRETLGPSDRRTLESLRAVGELRYFQGRRKDAVSLLREGSEIAGTALPEGDEVRLWLELLLGVALNAETEYAEAEALASSVAERAESSLGAASRLTIEARRVRASARSSLGRYDEAEDELIEVLELGRTALGVDDYVVLETLQTLAGMFTTLGRFPEALPHGEEAADLLARTLGPEHAETLAAQNRLSAVLSQSGQYDRALEVLEPLLDPHKRLFGETHPDTLAVIENAAFAKLQLGRREEALAEYEESERIRRTQTTGWNPNLATVLTNIGMLHLKELRFDEAERYLSEVATMRRTEFGLEHADTLMAVNNLGRMRINAGRAEEAVDELAEAASVAREVLGPESVKCGAVIQTYAHALESVRLFEEAEPLYLESMQILEATMDRKDFRYAGSAAMVARFYERWGKPDEAREWQALATP